MVKKVLLIALAVLCLGASPSPFSPEKAPVPPGVHIDQPDPSLPDEVKALSGVWKGTWNSRWGWDCVIYVQKIDRDSAEVVHAWGDYDTSRQSCHCPADWRRVRRATVTYGDGKATLEFKVRPYRPLEGMNPSHVVNGSVDPSRGKHYLFSFTVEKGEPDLMKGHFISGKASQLRVEMKRAGAD